MQILNIALPGAVADLSRLQERYRSMGRSKCKVQGDRKRRQLNATLALRMN